MARTTKTAAAAATTKPAAAAGKVGKVKPAAKPAKPAADDDAPRAPRGKYAGATLTVTEAGKAAAPRGNAGELWAAIVAHRNPADALGTKYQRTGGKYVEAPVTITGADLAYFVRRGLLAE